VEGGELLDPDGAIEYLRQWKDRIDQTAARTRAMADRLDQLRASATDTDGLAEVTVDSTGVLVDLHLTQRIHRVSPNAVARAILYAVQQARLEVARKSREIVIDEMGPESVAARAIAEKIEQRLQGPEGDERIRDIGR
jgi:hypothetical protein